MIDDVSPNKTFLKPPKNAKNVAFREFIFRFLIDNDSILEIADILTRRLSQVEKALGRSRLAN